MKYSAVSIHRSSVYLLCAGSFVLLLLSGFFYREKQRIQEENKQLILKNDSISSVNILLSDSIKKQPMGTLPKKLTGHKSDLR